MFLAVVDPGWEAEDCEFVITSDVFRLTYDRADTLLLAGCSREFNGDGRRDYALLLQNPNREIRPFAFIHNDSGYEANMLPPVSDRYGFDEDRSIPPGLFCRRKPPSGIFMFETESGIVTRATRGDIFRIGWQTYAWSDSGFVVIHMAD